MILAAWSAVAVLLGTAPGPDTLRLPDVIAVARAASPLLAAMRFAAEAAAERVAPAGALADPRLDLAVMNRMLGDPRSTRDPMTMNQVQFAQMLPWPGKLGASRERAARLAAAAGLDADETERALLAQICGVYYRMAYADRAVAVMEATQGLLGNFLAVAEARYAVGEALQQDVLQAQVAAARMAGDVLLMRAERAALGARLNALLGRGAAEPVGPLELPPADGPTRPAETLMRLAGRNRPALAAAGERVQAAEAATRAARREVYPDLMVGLQIATRPRYDDMAGLMIGVSVPLWAGARQVPLRREMRAMEAMARAEALQLANATFAELGELVARAERSRTLAALYATSILPQARAAVEGALSAYRVGRVNFMSVLENQMTVNRYETERLRLLAEYHEARAGIEALTGEPESTQ